MPERFQDCTNLHMPHEESCLSKPEMLHKKYPYVGTHFLTRSNWPNIRRECTKRVIGMPTKSATVVAALLYYIIVDLLLFL